MCFTFQSNKKFKQTHGQFKCKQNLSYYKGSDMSWLTVLQKRKNEKACVKELRVLERKKKYINYKKDSANS